MPAKLCPGVMAEPISPRTSPPNPDRRAARRPIGSLLSGLECRVEDTEPTRALHSIAILFRIMSGLLLLVMVVQVTLGLTSTVEISYGVLFGEAIRLLIFAGLLWAAGDLADLYIKSHCDIRATRILLARLISLVDRHGTSVPPAPDTSLRRDDAASHL